MEKLPFAPRLADFFFFYLAITGWRDSYQAWFYQEIRWENFYLSSSLSAWLLYFLPLIYSADINLCCLNQCNHLKAKVESYAEHLKCRVPLPVTFPAFFLVLLKLLHSGSFGLCICVCFTGFCVLTSAHHSWR